MADDRKTKFYWASVAGADPEPVELCTIDGREAVYTLGCQDPFFMDEGLVRLGKAEGYGRTAETYILNTEIREPMRRPVNGTVEGAKKASADHERYMSGVGVARGHAWRGPR